MRLYKLGEKSKALCQFCEQAVSTTFRERDVPLSSGTGMVSNILVAVCDTCDRIVGIPQQSVPRIQEVMHFSRHSIEARLPRHLLDALTLVCFKIGHRTSESRQTILFRFYVQRLNQSSAMSDRLGEFASSEEARGKAEARFSIKLSDEMYTAFLSLRKKSGLSQADLVRGIIIQMKRDLLDRKNEPLRESLQEIMLLAG